MTGMLGQLPPGLRGLLAAEQMNQQRSQSQLGQIGGLLSLQNSIEQQQNNAVMRPLQLQQLQLSLADAERQARIDEEIMRSRGMSGGGQPQGGGYSPSVSGAFGMPQQQSGATGVSGMPESIAMGLLSKRFAPLAKEESQWALEGRKLEQAQRQWENLSGYQRAQLQQNGIDNVFKFAELQDKGIQVPGFGGQPVPMSPPQQAPSGPGLMTPQQVNAFAPQASAIRSPQLAADQQRVLAGEAAGGVGLIPTPRVVAGSTAGMLPVPQVTPPRPNISVGPMAGLSPAGQRDVTKAARDAEIAAQLDSAKKQEENRIAEVQKNKDLERTMKTYVAARDGLMSGMEATMFTGPIMGRNFPLTGGQQEAEGGMAAMVPVLKQIFRVAGEGNFTDRDQEALMKMVPTRADTPESRAAKLANIDNIISAKLGMEIPPFGGGQRSRVDQIPGMSPQDRRGQPRRVVDY